MDLMCDREIEFTISSDIYIVHGSEGDGRVFG